jgi:arylsulfatase A-like enzyme
MKYQRGILFHLVSLAVVSIWFMANSCAPKSKWEKPNIIIINIDDMGWRDLGVMGSQFYETPNIDALAKEGMVFTNGYASASNCAPSRACLMTGKWSPRHGIYTVASSERGQAKHRKLIPIQNTQTLAKEHIIIPEILKEHGYTTWHAGKWHLNDDPSERGFDVNIGGNHAGHPTSYYPPYKNVDLEPTNGEYLTDLIMAKVVDLIASSTAPFFLNYSPYAVHTPIHPINSLKSKYENKPEWMGQNHVDYATMVDNLDRNIGLLIGALKEKRIYENTFVVFTSDNGGLYRVTKQRPLRAGKGSYYEGGIRVPFFFFWKGQITPLQEEDLAITNLDLFPTLLFLAGMDLDDYDFDGHNLLPFLTERAPIKERSLFWHFPIYLQASNNHDNQIRDSLFRTRPGSVVRLGEWKLHHYYEDDGIELYNLNDDISETKNLAEDLPEKKSELLSQLNTWRKEVNAPIPTELNPEFEP